MPPKRIDSFSGKRPRGRPPLAVNKRKFDTISHVTEKVEIVPKMKIIHPPLPLPVIVPRPIVHQNISIEPKIAILPKMLTHPVDVPETTGAGASSGSKTPARNQSQYPVQRVLNKLLVEDPMTIVSIGNALPDLTKDLLQSTLDILQVLGYVIKVKTGTTSKDKDANALFTTSNFARSSEPADVTQMATSAEQKWRSTELVKNRIQSLQVSCFHFYVYVK